MAFVLLGLVTTYLLGCKALDRISDFDAKRVPERLIAAFTEAIGISFLTQIPFIGFAVTLGFALAGMGDLMWPSLLKKLPVPM